jgi:adenylate cyclase
LIDRPGGFDDANIAGLLKVLPALALVSEIRLKNRLARTMLEIYVGSHAGEPFWPAPRARKRDDGPRRDLRNFTRISDNWPRDYLIDLLNDCTSIMPDHHGAGSSSE